MAKDIARHEAIARLIRSYKNIVNYDYWGKRANIEQGQDMIDARKNVYKGDQAFAEGLLTDARDYYTKGMGFWRKILDANPELVTDQTVGEHLVDVINRYRQILAQLDDPFPKDFILQDVWDAQMNQQGAPPPPPDEKEKPAEDKAAEEKPAENK